MPDDESEERADRGFTVVDRRGLEDEEARAEDATPRGEEAGPPGGGAGPGFTLVGDPHGEEQGPGGREALPPVDFSGLALSLATSALYHLGLVADPQTGEPGALDLRLARHTIDTLELLQEKTRGNLTQDEASLLANLLTELRMRFVEAGRDA
jgi:hypothetical protein